MPRRRLSSWFRGSRLVVRRSRRKASGAPPPRDGDEQLHHASQSGSGAAPAGPADSATNIPRLRPGQHHPEINPGRPSTYEHTFDGSVASMTITRTHTAGKFVFKHFQSGWRWELISETGQVMAEAGPFPNRTAENAIEWLKANVATCPTGAAL